VTFVLGILGLIFLIVIHELGHMLTAKAVGVRVPEFGIGFGPAIFKKRLGKTVYSFRIILLGGFAKMAGMGDGEEGPGTYQSKSAWRRAAIILAGPMANVLAAVVIFTGIYMSGVPRATNEIAGVVPNSLASVANIQKGDRIISVDGKEAANWEGFVQSVGQKKPGDRVELVVERSGEERTVSGELIADPENPGRALVGVRPVVVEDAYGPFEAVGQAVGRWPVGITSVASTSVSQGFFLPLLAIISLNLALFNLLPFLPLDGGHLFFIAAEKLLGRPVSEQTMGKFAAFGVALVLMLFVFATYADLSKILTGTPFIPE
jgi:regulator of sigma E protease